MTITIPTFLLLPAALCLGSLLVFLLIPRSGEAPAHAWFAKLGLDRVPAPLAALGLTIWVALFAAFLYGIFCVLFDLAGWTTPPIGNPRPSLPTLFWGLFDLAGRTTASIVDLRMSLLTLAALSAGLSALIALPFTLIKTRQAERQTYAREQDLVTDRINKAVENLGAEKTVSFQRTDQKGVETYEKDAYGKPDYSKPVMVQETRPNMEVRIGGLFALDRIARENLDFHVQIMQILCAYVRQNAPASGAVLAPDLDLPEPEEGADLREVWREWKKVYDESLTEMKAKITPRDDIQIAMELIGRRGPQQRAREAAWQIDGVEECPNPFDTPLPALPPVPNDPAAWKGLGGDIWSLMDRFRDEMLSANAYRPDLRHTNLQGYDLSALNLRGARLNEAQMQGANLWDAQMQGAILGGAQMQGANLWSAKMQGANLWGAQMQGADLEDAQMQGANLGGAQMQGAILGGAQMQGANLTVAKMQGANLWDAKMQGANLWDAKMQRANLRGAQMQGANLRGAQMQGANLTVAQMQGANLGGAQMQGAVSANLADILTARLAETDLSGVGFTPDQIKTAFGDGTATLPSGLTAGEGDLTHWPARALGFEYDAHYTAWLTDPDTYDPDGNY